MQHKMKVLFTILVLLGLSLATAGGAQAQGPDPLQKQMPLGGLSPEALSAAHEKVSTLPTDKANLIQDPSFELSFGSEAYWEQGSIWFGTPLCTIGVCGNGAGTAGPRSGGVWSWFGGVPGDEFAYLTQYSVPFPVCGAKLQFYFWIGTARAGSDANDRFIVQVDNTQVFSANATQKSSYPSYTLVTVDVSAFADGAPHAISFLGITTDQLVTFNLDDVSLLSGPCVTISGNALTEYVHLTYRNVRDQDAWTDASGNYSIQVPLHWSGTITPDYPDAVFSPASRLYSNVTTNRPGQNFTPLVRIGGWLDVAGATISYIDGTPKTVLSSPNGSYGLWVPLHWTGTITPTHPCFTFSPTEASFAGVVGYTPQNFTPSFNAGPGCADISLRVGGALQGRFGLLPQGSTRVSLPGVNAGPVKLESTNAVPIIGAERLIYKANNVATSFTEMMALPDNQLDTTYWLPWYNNVELDTQLRFANTSASSATVHVYVGGNEMTGSPFTLEVGASTRKSFPGINAGPVQIVSDQNIVAAERLIYRVNGVAASFSETMAVPNSQLDTTYWLPWYNNADLDTQLRFANVSGSPALVHVFIGGNEMTGSPFTLDPGASTRKSFAGVNAGPVQIVSDQDIVAAERLIYRVNNVATSFTEMMALPNSQLNTTYWLPWYNNNDLDTQLRFANVHDTQTATVHVLIGGVEMPNSPFTLLPGESTRKSFPGVNAGPVQIVSDVPIVAAERLIYKVNNVAASFSEMMALPDSQLDSIYWLPWYNNVDLDTQLRFGVP
jgi:hypothetical protein